MVLELRVEDEPVDTFGFTVSVVEDACALFEGQESMVKVPNRFGRPGPCRRLPVPPGDPVG